MNPAGSAKTNSLSPSLSLTLLVDPVGLNLKAHKIPITKGKHGVGTGEVEADHESVVGHFVKIQADHE